MFQKVLSKIGYRKFAKGRWRVIPAEQEWMIEIQCSECGARKFYCLRESDLFDYFPRCGAEMLGEVDNE